MNEQNFNPADTGKKNKQSNLGFQKFLMTYFIATIVIIAVVSVGFTMKMHDFRGHGPFGVLMEKVIKDLDLNDQQKTEIEKIKEEVKAKMDEKKQNRGKDMEGFGNMFKQDKMDKEQMTALAKKHDADREEMRNFFIDELIKVHDVLTPEQRSKAVDKLKELKEKRGKQHDDGTPGDKQKK
jgi:periplasmic protein CpxP/Spy